MGSVKIKNVEKKFGDFTALKDINLEIQEGEFFALLGPSGCGKTTTMRCIAGFEDPTSGSILIGDKEVKNVPANKRNCGMVFQSYALFPHMTVYDNVAYSLNIKDLNNTNFFMHLPIYLRMMSRRFGKGPKRIQTKVKEILDYVELGHLAERLTSELSGGQQQRVALARALIMEPAVLLMDEPLSNLDQKLRHTMRNTIRRIQQEMGITTIFVTHDQEEAMSMADRIAVLNNGEIVQLGTPTELYSNPSTPFIADFVGTSNILNGSKSDGDSQSVTLESGLSLKTNHTSDNKDVKVVIRPEHINMYVEENINEEEGYNYVAGVVEISTYLGPSVRYEIQAQGTQFIVDHTYSAGEKVYDPGTPVKLSIPFERVLLL
ncbi:ABC transporter ATP-binding protein [Corticicoccus populi]|uniref:ABC transporter ATP-binding protein n=1 Tax=Corticicoccus populi TaxID=1812821 RepID=A0ABW5WVZ9_9STAP